MGAKLLDLMGGGLAGVVTGEPFLAGLEEVLRPTVVEVLGDAFLAAQLGDTVLAAHAFEHDADLLLGRELAPRRSADIPDELLGAVRLPSIPVSHHRSPQGQREPGTLSYAITSICPTGADGGHSSEHRPIIQLSGKKAPPLGSR